MWSDVIEYCFFLFSELILFQINLHNVFGVEGVVSHPLGWCRWIACWAEEEKILSILPWGSWRMSLWLVGMDCEQEKGNGCWCLLPPIVLLTLTMLWSGGSLAGLCSSSVVSSSTCCQWKAWNFRSSLKLCYHVVNLDGLEIMKSIRELEQVHSQNLQLNVGLPHRSAIYRFSCV